ncbi:colanic acid exporter [Falsiruegeria litorea R37]|uniref:Colanic acid exporter n=1 Tax=Falsiruegeria litorea R37 TaxID=1200284 RepID=A0A1Y5TN09_9RHOB|nr:oligosaccharide flippase family protein [Falsiruegeria litorea]SLN67435.1 colanic acid exporter [Falsiruegeria litorea R37]
MICSQLSGRPLVWGVPVLAEAAALGRSVVFAHVLGPDELGQAMMLALTVRMAEMASDFGIDRLMVQAADGETARLQAELQGVSVLRGLIVGVILLGLAPVFALVLGKGPDSAAYAFLALVPVARGFVHLDFRRFERRFRYGAMARVEAGATLVAAVAVFPAALMFQDHRAMSAVLVMHAMTFALLSHAAAVRPYRLAMSWGALERVYRFGAPLMMNAALLFCAFYADRLIVAEVYGWAVLAVYGIALQLAMLPAQIAGRAAASLLLPRLSAAHREKRLPQIWTPVLAGYIAGATGFAASFVFFAPAAIEAVYGSAFRPDPLLSVAVAMAGGFRILRTPFSQLAVATGRTADPARANLIRALAIVPAAFCAMGGLPLAAVAWAAALGEAGATIRAVLQANTTLKPTLIKEVFA